MRDNVRVKWWRNGLRSRLRHLSTVVLDVDGVLTDGSIYSTESGRKLVKMFGPDDHDAIKHARERGMRVLFTSSDRLGWDISSARIAHMGGELIYSGISERAQIMEEENDVYLPRALYIGDGYHDDELMRQFGVGACPSDAWPGTIRAADIVSSRPGGRRAVAQIIYYVLQRAEA